MLSRILLPAIALFKLGQRQLCSAPPISKSSTCTAFGDFQYDFRQEKTHRCLKSRTEMQLGNHAISDEVSLFQSRNQCEQGLSVSLNHIREQLEPINLRIHFNHI